MPRRLAQRCRLCPPATVSHQHERRYVQVSLPAGDAKLGNIESLHVNASRTIVKVVLEFSLEIFQLTAEHAQFLGGPGDVSAFPRGASGPSHRCGGPPEITQTSQLAAEQRADDSRPDRDGGLRLLL